MSLPVNELLKSSVAGPPVSGQACQKGRTVFDIGGSARVTCTTAISMLYTPGAGGLRYIPLATPQRFSQHQHHWTVNRTINQSFLGRWDTTQPAIAARCWWCFFLDWIFASTRFEFDVKLKSKLCIFQIELCISTRAAPPAVPLPETREYDDSWTNWFCRLSLWMIWWLQISID